MFEVEDVKPWLEKASVTPRPCCRLCGHRDGRSLARFYVRWHKPTWHKDLSVVVQREERRNEGKGGKRRPYPARSHTLTRTRIIKGGKQLSVFSEPPALSNASTSIRASKHCIERGLNFIRKPVHINIESKRKQNATLFHAIQKYRQTTSILLLLVLLQLHICSTFKKLVLIASKFVQCSLKPAVHTSPPTPNIKRIFSAFSKYSLVVNSLRLSPVQVKCVRGECEVTAARAGNHRFLSHALGWTKHYIIVTLPHGHILKCLTIHYQALRKP